MQTSNTAVISALLEGSPARARKAVASEMLMSLAGQAGGVVLQGDGQCVIVMPSVRPSAPRSPATRKPRAGAGTPDGSPPQVAKQVVASARDAVINAAAEALSSQPLRVGPLLAEVSKVVPDVTEFELEAIVLGNDAGIIKTARGGWFKIP